jgi:hypothetical protein
MITIYDMYMFTVYIYNYLESTMQTKWPKWRQLLSQLRWTNPGLFHLAVVTPPAPPRRICSATWKWIWWYHDDTMQTRLLLVSVGCCSSLLHVSTLWLFLCLQPHVTWLNGSICAILLPTRKQGCSEVCHNLFANMLASLVLRGHQHLLRSMYARTTWNCTQIASATSNTLGKQSLMPSMFRASPWEVIPLEAQRGSAWQRGIESQWGLLGCLVLSGWRRRIPILQDPQDDWSDSSGWLRPFILAGVTSEF